MADKKTVTRQLSIFINDKEVVNSLSGISREMGKVRGQIGNLNRDSEDYDEKLSTLKKTLADLTTRQSYFKDEINGTDKALGTSMKSLAGVEQRMGEITKELRLLDAESEDYQKTLHSLKTEYASLEKQQKEYSDNISLTTKKQEVNKNSLNGIEHELGQVKEAMRDLDKTSANYRQEISRLQKEEAALQKQQAQMSEEIHGTTEELGAARGAFSNLFSGLKSGDLTMAAAGLSGIKTAIIATTKAGLAFIATPIGATIAALAGIALAAKAWYDYNTEVVKATQVTAAITKLSGEALDDTRKRASVLAETFDQDFEQLLNVASTLVSEFGISYEEAFDRIQDGLTKGGYANEEFLESLREYPTFFAQAGFSAKEFQNILNTGADLSIYQDKLPDAIKEFGLAITEQTKAASEALTNAFGPEFTSYILTGVKNGSISVKDALFEISKEAKRLGLNAQQAQLLTADLFKGAGEDAGGALKIFQAVTQSLENQKRPLTEIEKGFTELADKAKEVADAEERAFGSKGFATWQKNFSLFFGTVKREFYDFLFVMTNGQDALDKLRAKQRQGDSDKRVYESNLKNYKGFLDGQKKALGERYDFEAAKELYMSVLKERYAKAGAGNIDATKEQLELQKRLEGQMKIVEKYNEEIKTNTNKNDLADITARIAANKKKLELLEAHKQEEKEAFKTAEKEITALLKKSQEDSELRQYKGIEKEIKQITNKYAAELEKFKAHTARLKELEAARDKEIADVKAAKALEYGKQIDDINRELTRSALAAQFDAEIEAATTAEAKRLLELEKQKSLDDEQAEAELAKALTDIENVENTEALKYAITEKYRLRRERSDAAYLKNKKELDKKATEAERLAQIKKIDDTLNEMSRLTNALVEIFGQSKAAASAQAAINGALAVTEILKTPSVLPEPAASISRGIQIAGVVIKTAKSISQINSAKAPKAAKFFDGGYTGDEALYNDKYGKVTQVNEYHANEWVMPNVMLRQPRYANVAGWLEAERKQPGSAGPLPGAGSQAGATTATASIAATAALIEVVAQLNATLQGGIKATTQIGYDTIRDINKANREITASGANGTINKS